MEIIKKYPTAAGKTGRRRQVQDVAALLLFAVEDCGAPPRWLPPNKKFLAKLIGTNKDAEKPYPIKDAQLIFLDLLTNYQLCLHPRKSVLLYLQTLFQKISNFHEVYKHLLGDI